MQSVNRKSGDDISSHNAIVFIGLGSSLGHRRRYLQRAISKIAHHSHIVLLEQSSVWFSVPIGAAKHIFLNMVIRVRTQLAPEKLLLFLQSIENECGRKRGVHWMDRVLDLDILLYGDICVQSEFLTIPHPRILERNFVLFPLREIQKKVNITSGILSSTIQDVNTQLPWFSLPQQEISSQGIWKSHVSATAYNISTLNSKKLKYG